MKKLIVTTLIIFTVMFLMLFAETKVETEAEIKDTWISQEYVQICEQIGAQYHISPELLVAIIERESSGQANISNPLGCVGLMQVYATYHQERMARLGVTNLYDPYSNILVGADILHENFVKYEDTYTAIGAYAGYSNVVQRVQQGDYPDYALAVLKRAEELEFLHGKTNYSTYQSNPWILHQRYRED